MAKETLDEQLTHFKSHPLVARLQPLLTTMLVSIQNQWNMQANKLKLFNSSSALLMLVYSKQWLLRRKRKGLNYISLVYGGELQFVFQLAWTLWSSSVQAAVCPPVFSDGTKKRNRSVCGRKLMLGNCSFRSGPFWVKLHWTQHGFGFSVCCVIGPWPAFCASDPCPISSEPNETISPVRFVVSVRVWVKICGFLWFKPF